MLKLKNGLILSWVIWSHFKVIQAQSVRPKSSFLSNGTVILLDNCSVLEHSWLTCYLFLHPEQLLDRRVHLDHIHGPTNVLISQLLVVLSNLPKLGRFNALRTMLVKAFKIHLEVVWHQGWILFDLSAAYVEIAYFASFNEYKWLWPLFVSCLATFRLNFSIYLSVAVNWKQKWKLPLPQILINNVVSMHILIQGNAFETTVIFNGRIWITTELRHFIIIINKYQYFII